ncbi:type IV secretion system protein TraC [Salmonella enterica]|nr:type IV secretion system protein TraC [Salmonella enterica]EKC6528490.1 type IV secretion system protein TraC [Salmonella enterica]ELL0230519.1 type IV secretion system protein TraC [Salmonella enterica]MEI04939.1 type IV secretion system protein TraC [Salmonella enterica]
MKKFLNVLENLQNAFRMPDGASEMTRNLASLDFPQLTSVLPYRDYDRDSGLFVNRSTVGFLLRAEPLIGANEQIVYVLEDLIKSKLPRKTPISFHLVSSKLIGDQLDRGLSEFRWQGKHADKFNRITRAYYQRAAQQQFNSPTGLPLTLRDYRLYISYCVKAKKRTAAVMTEVAHTLKVLRSSLDAAKIYTQAADDQELATLVHGMLNARHDQLYPDEVRVGKFDELHQRCVDQRIGIDVRPDDVLISLADRQGSVTSTRAMNFMLENNPDMFMLWMGGDNLSNLLSPDLTIASPFVITMVMEAEDQVATQGEATRKYLDREKKANSPYATLFPGVAKQAKEWKEIREHLNSNQTCIVRYYYNVTTFCPDTDEDALVCEQQVINTFKKNGIDLFSPTYMQFRNWIAMIPFIHAEGLWEDIKMGGATSRAESIQAVNLLPVVADNRLCQGGLLTPSYRNQLAFLDIYGDGMGNTNYNMAVTGTSGAGKTGLVQPILRSVLDSGGIAWVFDMGDGYKSFCENVGGTYLDGKSLKFNPFANISNINESGERIRDQLAVLASPNGTLDEVHHSLLLRGVQEAWEAHKEKARIDHVVQKLTAIREDDKYQNSPGITNRLDEIIELLGKYCSWGIYGEYFNSDEPSLTDDARFIVLELGGLQDKPDLLVAVMFSLIIYIEDKMYRTPRSLKKCCTIDEGWKLLNFKNEKVGQFIETGYRTVRRHRGAFITISQNIKDFDADDASGAAKAAWGNSAFKVVLKQDASEFKQYNQNRPNQFSELERSVISKFGDAKDQWFSSFMLRINDTCSFHRLFVDPLSRAMFSSKGDDFEFIRQCREQNMDIHDAVYQLAQRNFPDEMRELEALAEAA